MQMPAAPLGETLTRQLTSLNTPAVISVSGAKAVGVVVADASVAAGDDGVAVAWCDVPQDAMTTVESAAVARNGR